MLHHFYFKRQLLSLYILAFELKAVRTFYYLAVMLRFLLPFFFVVIGTFFPFFSYYFNLFSFCFVFLPVLVFCYYFCGLNFNSLPVDLL